MINDEREKKDKEKITIKFLLTNNNYNYMVNDEREKKDKEKITIKFLLSNTTFYPPGCIVYYGGQHAYFLYLVIQPSKCDNSIGFVKFSKN